MPDRTTLARLGKLVAADVTTGRAGANSWAASQALEAHPEAVLDLIEMLFTEGRKTRPNEKLVSAYVYMIGQALEVIRMALENGQASAQELADAVRQILLQAGASGLVQPVLLVMVLMEFANAKLIPVPTSSTSWPTCSSKSAQNEELARAGATSTPISRILRKRSAVIRSRSTPRCWRWQQRFRQTTAPPWASRSFGQMKRAPERPLWAGCSTPRLRCGMQWHLPLSNRPHTGPSQAACSGA